MRISRSTTFAHGVEEVFAIIATQEHQLAKVTSDVGASSATVTEGGDGTVLVRTRRRLPTRDMPSTVSSLVGPTLVVDEQQTWRSPATDGTRTADIGIDVEGAPVRLRGTVTLTPADGGSRLVVDADLTCSVPFVGKKVEAAAKPVIEESFDLETRLLNRRLG